MPDAPESRAAALARLYDLDLSEDPGDIELYYGLAARADGPIVELAVGTGRIAVPLATAGHEVIGVDSDTAMLDRARARARAAGPAISRRLRLLRHDMVDLRPADLGLAPGDLAGGGVAAGGRAPAGLAALAILGLNSILLLADRDRQRQVIATMGALVRPGGLVVVDAWLPTADDVARFDGRLSLEWLRSDPETGRDVVKLASAWYDEPTRQVTLTTIFDEAEPGSAPRRWTRQDELRLISADELVAFAGDAGLVVEQLGGDHDLGPLEADSERAVLVARKSG